MPRNSIYKITNTTNGKFYVGSTKDSRKRFWKHKYELNKGIHPNMHLQASWMKYGEKSFSFSVLATFENEAMLRQFEHSMLPSLVSDPNCYNKSMGVIAPKHTQDTKQRISSGVQQAHTEKRGIYKGYKQDEEHRQAISDALKGNQNAKGYKRTEAEREAIRQRTLGNQYWLNKKHSVESKDKMGTTAYAEAPDGFVTEYISINEMRMQLGMAGLSGILRAVKSGYPLVSGTHAGWRFFTEKEDNRAVIPDEYKHLPRSRVEAKTRGEKLYFNTIPCKRGHVAPRKAKGTCTMCPA